MSTVSTLNCISCSSNFFVWYCVETGAVKLPGTCSVPERDVLPIFNIQMISLYLQSNIKDVGGDMQDERSGTLLPCISVL